MEGLVRRVAADQGLTLEEALGNDEICGRTFPVGVIPCGSTDSIAYSLHGTADVETAAVRAVLGHARGLDAMAVYAEDRQVPYAIDDPDRQLLSLAVTVASGGFLGRNLLLSERLRWMGPARYEAAGAVTFLRHKPLKGNTPKRTSILALICKRSARGAALESLSSVPAREKGRREESAYLPLFLA